MTYDSISPNHAKVLGNNQRGAYMMNQGGHEGKSWDAILWNGFSRCETILFR
jgi:hypothetical protein